MIPTQNALVPFIYQAIQLLECVWINGKPWFTREAIGKWLGYLNPRISILMIEKRHPSIKQFSMKVKLPSFEATPTGNNLLPVDSDPTGIKLTPHDNGRIVEREFTVYNLIGLQLIVAYANRPQRDTYLLNAAQAINDLQEGKLLPSRWCKSGDQLAAFKQLLSYPPKRDRSEIVLDIAKQQGVSPKTIYRQVRQSGEYLVTSRGGRKKSPTTKDTHSKPEEVTAIFEYRKQHPKAGGIEIKAALGLSYSAGHINLILRTQKPL